MSYVNPNLREQFESMPIRLKNAVLERNVRINTLNDLIECLEQIVEQK